MIKDIEELVKIVKDGMKATGIQRLSIGQQIVVKIALSDFIQAFGESSKCYKLGSEIRVDANGITFCADRETGTLKENEL
jgi:hypothetical protein